MGRLIEDRQGFSEAPDCDQEMSLRERREDGSRPRGGVHPREVEAQQSAHARIVEIGAEDVHGCFGRPR